MGAFQLCKSKIIFNFSKIQQRIYQLIGWHTKSHILIIESDDWGSIRMPSKKVYEELRLKGYSVDKCLFSRYDSLETDDDLSRLFEILSSIHDRNGHPVIMTANSVVANPDFEKIKESGYKSYYYEPVIETFRQQDGCSKSYEIIKQGISEGLWHPQLHGREHLNVIRWMKALQDGDEVTRLCFEQRHFSLTTKASPKIKARYMDGFGNADIGTLSFENETIREAADLFEEIYGYRSKSFIAPCYIWRRELEPILKMNGIDYLQGLPLQQIPVEDDPLRCKTKFHYLGQKNKQGQYYLIRNAFFEPYKGTSENDVDDCLNRISIAFRCRKPAIISTHRLNYIGTLDTAHRDKNLKKLKLLLTSIKKKWPDVEFMSSDQLGDLISGK